MPQPHVFSNKIGQRYISLRQQSVKRIPKHHGVSVCIAIDTASLRPFKQPAVGTVTYLSLARAVQGKRIPYPIRKSEPMKSWRPTLEKISKALEFANIDSLNELETLLESHAEGEPAVPATDEDAVRKPFALRPPLHAKYLKLSGSH